jgi:N-acetylneuraminic acid mutarotase
VKTIVPAVLALLGLAACQADSLPSEPTTLSAVDPRADVVGVTNSWATRASLPSGRTGVVAAAVDGVIYAIGGKSGGQSLAKVVAYYPGMAGFTEWRSKAPLPESAAHFNGAAVIDGKIYVTGGYNLLSNEPYLRNWNLRYDPEANTWSSLAPLPQLAYGGVSAALNGKLYVYVVYGPDGNWQAALYRYDPATDTWTERANPPAIQKGATSGVMNGKLYIAGGFSGPAAPVATLTMYNPATDTWRTKAPMSTARGGATGRAINGKLYVAGGNKALSLEPLALTEVYDPATNSWSKRADMKTPRYAAGSAALNGNLYVLGGYGGTRTNEMYIP